MYGTIFNLEVKPGHEAELIKVFNEEQAKPAGAVALFVMQPDNNGRWIGVAIFQSKETYVANAESPEQHTNFLKMMEHLESEPEWTDGTYVISQTL